MNQDTSTLHVHVGTFLGHVTGVIQNQRVNELSAGISLALDEAYDARYNAAELQLNASRGALHVPEIPNFQRRGFARQFTGISSPSSPTSRPKLARSTTTKAISADPPHSRLPPRTLGRSSLTLPDLPFSRSPLAPPLEERTAARTPSKEPCPKQVHSEATAQFNSEGAEHQQSATDILAQQSEVDHGLRRQPPSSPGPFDGDLPSLLRTIGTPGKAQSRTSSAPPRQQPQEGHLEHEPAFPLEGDRDPKNSDLSRPYSANTLIDKFPHEVTTWLLGAKAHKSRSPSPEEMSPCAKQHKVVIEAQHHKVGNITDELAETRAKLAEQRARFEDVKESYRHARQKEKTEYAKVVLNRKERRRVVNNLVTRMQSGMRGWLSRRRFVLSVQKKANWNSNWEALLPRQLNTHLQELQHLMHGLLYHPDDWSVAALCVQAWWRGVLGRRVARVLQLRRTLEEVYFAQIERVIHCQRLFRGHRIRRKWKAEILLAAHDKYIRQMHEMQMGLRHVIQMQRSFRAKLAKRKVEEKLTERQKALMQCHVGRNHSPIEEVTPWQTGTPRVDNNLKEFSESGLLAFYMRRSHESSLLRHQIGGSSAAGMQRQLLANSSPAALWGAPPAELGGSASLASSAARMISMGSSATDSLASTDGKLLASAIMAGSATDSLLSIEDGLASSMPRDPYLEGVSPGFLDGLDPDVWPRDPWLRAHAPPKQLRPCGNNGGCSNVRAGKPRRRGPTRPVSGAPTHAEQRAMEHDRREEINAQLPAPPSPSAHPLLMNAPWTPSPPSPRRPNPAAPLRRLMIEEGDGGEDECAWPGATRIFQRQRKLAPLALTLGHDSRQASGAEMAAMALDTRHLI